VLGIDTSSGTSGVALYEEHGRLAEESWRLNKTTEVLPAVARLWRSAAGSVKQTKLVVVATGPGSFTGLRVGLSIGKGLALALGCPLVGVPTLDSVAYQHAALERPLLAVVAAGRGQLYVAEYVAGSGRLARVSEYAVRTAEELAAQLSRARRGLVVCGELTAAEAALLGRRAAATVGVLTGAAALRRPGFLAELGVWTWSRDGAADPATVEPLYLRRAPGEGRPAAA
jgi:tRNA threonylcarbamoyladenosine biosynthesis protein TsaB